MRHAIAHAAYIGINQLIVVVRLVLFVNFVGLFGQGGLRQLATSADDVFRDFDDFQFQRYVFLHNRVSFNTHFNSFSLRCPRGRISLRIYDTHFLPKMQEEICKK